MADAEPKTHELKCWPEYFEAVADGRKPFELREDDRGYMEGDTLRLREYDPATDAYTGREIQRQVTYILRSSYQSPIGAALRRQFVIMGLAATAQLPAVGEAAEAEPEGDGGLWALTRLYDYTSEAGHYEARKHIINAALALGVCPDEWDWDVLTRAATAAPEADGGRVWEGPHDWQPYTEHSMLVPRDKYWIYNTAAGIVQHAQYAGPGTDKEALWKTHLGIIFNKYVSHYAPGIHKPAPPATPAARPGTRPEPEQLKSTTTAPA